MNEYPQVNNFYGIRVMHIEKLIMGKIVMSESVASYFVVMADENHRVAG